MKLTARSIFFCLLFVGLLTVTASAIVNSPQGKIKHVIIVVQENRTPENLFFANSVLVANGGDVRPPGNPPYGLCTILPPEGSNTYQIPLTGTQLNTCFDTRHLHEDWRVTYHNGAMDGACYVSLNIPDNCTVPDCQTPLPDGRKCPAYSYVSNPTFGVVATYFDIANKYGFANRFFQNNRGPSYPAHQFLFGGTSLPVPFSQDQTRYKWYAADNPVGIAPSDPASCISPLGANVSLINTDSVWPNCSQNPNDPQCIFPCLEHNTMADLFGNSVSWKYYTPASGNLWDAPEPASTTRIRRGAGPTLPMRTPTMMRMKTDRSAANMPTGAGSGFMLAPEAYSTIRRRAGILLRIVVLLSPFLFFTFPQFSFGASSFKVLHAFGAGTDGAGIQSSVTVDKKGNVYGTTSYGGTGGYGTVFKLRRMPDGSWSEKILQSFSFGDPNGQNPFAPVTFDSAGNLYGTTVAGGANRAGTVFQMTHGPSGWNFKVLYDFCSQPDCVDGGGPWAGVAFDDTGNLFGTAFNVFELSPTPDGWTESVLYNFCQQPDCYDGWLPRQGVILDDKGDLYGATQSGGDQYGGVVYKLHHRPDGTWRYHVLHRFQGPPDDGEDPVSGMLIAMDGSGNLYGTTALGGLYGCDVTTCGVAFRLSRQPDGHWKETILHKFKFGKGGYWPGGGVVVDGAGNLYGTTLYGGPYGGGVVFKLRPECRD